MSETAPITAREALERLSRQLSFMAEGISEGVGAADTAWKFRNATKGAIQMAAELDAALSVQPAREGYNVPACCICNKSIIQGPYRAREAGGRYLLAHSSCASDDPAWSALSAPPAPVETAKEIARAEGMDEAVTFVLETLAKDLGVDRYEPCDGTDDWRCDVAGTVWNILCAGKVFDPETNERCPHPAAPAPVEPVAWSYELASYRNDDGSYTGWKAHLTTERPHVPEGSIRNLTPLYPPAPSTGEG